MSIETTVASAGSAQLSWQPIETAPIDGTSILFVNKMFDRVMIGRYKNGHIWTGAVTEQPSAIPREWADIASAWMPLPPKPGEKLTPPPSSHVVGDLDYCFDPENWEFTCSWPERDQVHGYGESLTPGQPMRVCTLLKGPDKWVADVPITWDEDGEPDETEVKWFDSEEEARAALANKEGFADA